MDGCPVSLPPRGRSTCPRPGVRGAGCATALANVSSMKVDDYDSVILFVGDLGNARTFYVRTLGLPIRFEDEIIVVVGGSSGKIVLHRSDRGHDERGIFPAGTTAGAASLRFKVEDPDAWEEEARRAGVPILWPTQEATWGRFVVVADPDGRPVALAKMNTI